MTVIDIFIKHESEIRKPTKIITQFDRCNKCNINGTDTVENELEFMHVISSESHQRWLSSIVMRFQKIRNNMNGTSCHELRTNSSSSYLYNIS